MFRPWFSFKNNKRTIVLLVGIFEKALKKLIAVNNAILAVFDRFWQLLTYLVHLKKIDQKDICASIVFKA